MRQELPAVGCETTVVGAHGAGELGRAVVLGVDGAQAAVLGAVPGDKGAGDITDPGLLAGKALLHAGQPVWCRNSNHVDLCRLFMPASDVSESPFRGSADLNQALPGCLHRAPQRMMIHG